MLSDYELVTGGLYSESGTRRLYQDVIADVPCRKEQEQTAHTVYPLRAQRFRGPGSSNKPRHLAAIVFDGGLMPVLLHPALHQVDKANVPECEERERLKIKD